MGMCQEPILGSVSPSRQSVHETQTPHGVESNDPNTAYRVQGIPQRFDQAELEVAIRELLHVEEHERVIIRCFTTNLSQGYRGTRSAVFNLACVYLPQEISGAGQRWVFPSFRGSVTGEVLVIDSSFKGLTVLYEPEPTMHQFDFIAIPGLGGGHAWGSFRVHGGTHLWLLDDLPKDWPTARVLVYGYDTRLRNQQSKQDLEELAVQFSEILRYAREDYNNQTEVIVPFVFLAHSIGGLLLKQTLITMSRSLNPLDRANFYSTFAILFYGVPNQGLRISDLGLAAMVKDQPMKEFLYDLRTDSPLLANLSEEYRRYFNFHDSIVFSVSETKKSPTAELKDGVWAMTGPLEMFVNAVSAFNGRQWEHDANHMIQLEADHSGLVRFAARDENYIITLKLLTSLDAARARDVIQRRLDLLEERIIKN